MEKLIQKKLLIITSYVTFAWVLYLIFCITDRKFSINIVDLLLQYSLTIFCAIQISRSIEESGTEAGEFWKEHRTEKYLAFASCVIFPCVHTLGNVIFNLLIY